LRILANFWDFSEAGFLNFQISTQKIALFSPSKTDLRQFSNFGPKFSDFGPKTAIFGEKTEKFRFSKN
jgi:hypothetical protein